MMAPGSMGEHVCAQGKFAKRALQTSSPSSRQNHCLRPIARPELSAKDRLDPACLACVSWRQSRSVASFPSRGLEQKRGSWWREYKVEGGWWMRGQTKQQVHMGKVAENQANPARPWSRTRALSIG